MFKVCINDSGQVNVLLLESSKYIANYIINEDVENRVVNLEIIVKPILIGSHKQGSITFELDKEFDDLIINGLVIPFDSVNTCPEEVLELINYN